MKEILIFDAGELGSLFKEGCKHLKKEYNGVNPNSSRCHGVFQIKLINELGKLNEYFF